MNNYHKYLTVTPAEEAWGFYLTTVGYSRTNPNQAYPPNPEHPHTHSFTWNKGRILNGYYLVFISKGKGTFESALTEPCPISAGTCFFLFPGVWHRYKPDPASGWEEYWIGFKGSYPETLMNKGFFDPAKPVMSAGLNENLLHLINKILDLVRLAPLGYHQVISGITLEILGLLYTRLQSRDPDGNQDEQVIAHAKFILRENLETSLDMETLASELAIGYSKFRKMFKEATGHSPNQYHIDLRLDKARELLTATNLNVTEIAYQLGFESVYYFSRLFKKKNGVSPKSYRDGETHLDKAAATK
jgi:AraC-like DNA-binding protein